MAYLGLDAKKLLQNVANSQVLAGQPAIPPQTPTDATVQPGQQNTAGMIDVSANAPSQAPPSPTLGKATPSSGSFTNLQKYVQKNEPGSAKLAGAVGQNLQTAAERAKTAIAQTQQKFGTELESGSLQGRDTAVQEALKVAQQAAGGVQQQKTAADLQAVYKQPIESLQTQISAGTPKLAEMQAAQKQYQGYSAATPIFGKVDSYLKGFTNNIDAAWGAGNINSAFGVSNISKVNKALSDLYNPIYQSGRNIQEQTTAMLQSDAARKAVAQALGADTSYYSDWKSGNKAAPSAPGIGGAIIQDIAPQAKYFDQSKAIASQQEAQNKAQQDLELYQGLANMQQAPEVIPELLKTASTFGGDVSEQRFKDIINAAYKGPGNLYDIKGYEQALASTKESERRMGLLGPRGLDASLLETVFKGKGRDYTAGQKNLDQLLLGTPEKLQQLQATKAGIGSAQDVMTAAETGARGSAAERTDLINQLKSQARGGVQDVATARSGQVESRLGSVIQNWEKLPQYFRDAITKQAGGTGNVKLSELEAQMLGVGSGEGLYNVVRDLGIGGVIKSGVADKEKLISQAEQSQLANLQKLAEMGDTRGVAGDQLGFTSAYQDPTKAGQQTAYSALDTENLRKVLNEAETGFGSAAAGSNIVGTGVGSDRYKSGFKSKTVNVRANLNANLKDVLTKAGYDFNKPMSTQTSDPRVMAAVTALAKGGNNILTPDNSWFSGDPNEWGALGAQYLNKTMGMGAFLPENMQVLTNINKGMASLEDISRKIPLVGGSIGGAIGSIGGLWGSGAGHAQSTAAKNAARAAQADLKAKVAAQLGKLGYSNRLDISNEDPAVRARRLQLAQTMGGIDLTNTQLADTQTDRTLFAQDPLEFARRINASNRRS